MTTDRLPPQDLEAEQALVGALLASDQPGLPWDLDEILAVVDVLTFADPHCRAVFAVLTSVVGKGDPIDWVAFLPLLVADHDQPVGELGWDVVLANLSQACPAVVNGPYYARVVRDKWRLRAVIRATQQAEQAAYEPEADATEVSAVLAKQLGTIEQAGQLGHDAVTEADVLRAYENPTPETRRVVPVTLGYLGKELDGGLERGDLIIAGGRPSTGKTSLGLGLCLGAVAASEGCPCLFVSCEMLTKALALRLLAMRASIAVRDIRTGHFAQGEYDGIQAAAVRQAEAGHTLYLLDEVVDVHAITAHARRAARQHHVGMVVVDYLGLCTIAQKFDRNDLRVGEMARLFKVLAQATRMAVVVLVQLSRRPATEKRAPVLSDLRDSGNIEEHADVVLFLYPSGDNDEVANTQIIVAKQRQGQTGSAQVGYRRATMQYVAHADAQQEAP